MTILWSLISFLSSSLLLVMSKSIGLVCGYLLANLSASFFNADTTSTKHIPVKHLRTIHVFIFESSYQALSRWSCPSTNTRQLAQKRNQRPRSGLSCSRLQSPSATYQTTTTPKLSFLIQIRARINQEFSLSFLSQPGDVLIAGREFAVRCYDRLESAKAVRLGSNA